MDNSEIVKLHQQLFDLRLEHGDLDLAIDTLNQNPHVNQLQLRRLKKRKLLLKDAIVKLESKLIPDLNA